MDSEIGARIEALLASARHEVLIVAPFIQRRPFERLLSAIPAAVPSITCVTRWLPEDVAAGVSDLAVLDSVRAREGARLLLHARLHAKLFRADAATLVGSANITGRALGWSSRSNLELLVSESPDDAAALVAFEADLLGASIPATETLRAEIQAAADKIPPSPRTTASDQAELDVPSLDTWIPTCPSPDRLWSIYAKDPIAWQVIHSAERAAREDLVLLQLPNDLPISMFNQIVLSALMQSKAVIEIDKASARGIPPEEGAQLIRSFKPDISDQDALAAFEIVLRWMEYFMPNKYRRTATVEVFQKGRTIG